MSDSSGRHWLVFNGEIYNYRKIRLLLEREGVQLQTTSDTEVLLKSMIHWGIEALGRLEGMFAFAWWDRETRRLILVRDRFGIKPLYYTVQGGFFAFASEIKALLALPETDRRIDRMGLRDYLVHRYVPGPRTIYHHIQSLPPGHLLVLNPTSTEVSAPQRWWSYNTEFERSISMDEAAEELDDLLKTVCSEHLVSDVPMGAFLSGGLDSSAILAYAQGNSMEPLQAVSVGFKGMERSKFDETHIAQQVAEHLGSSPIVVKLNVDLLLSLSGTLAALDEPMSDPSTLPAFKMMEVARNQAKVMLSGDGGDEVFGGYNRYKHVLQQEKRASAKIYTLMTLFRTRDSVPSMQRYLAHMAVIPIQELSDIVYPDFLPDETYVPLDARFPFARNRDALTQWQQLDLQTYMADDNLKKVDRMGMAHGVEVRVPMVDHRLVEFGLSLPSRLRLHGRTGKAVLRRCLCRRLPLDVLQRKKVGFKVPLRAWLRGNQATPIVDAFLDVKGPIWKIVRREAPLHWLEEHRAGKRNYEARLWNLIVLNEWLRQVRLL